MVVGFFSRTIDFKLIFLSVSIMNLGCYESLLCDFYLSITVTYASSILIFLISALLFLANHVFLLCVVQSRRMTELRDELIQAVTQAVNVGDDRNNFISLFGASGNINVPLGGGPGDNFDKWIKHFDRAAQAARIGCEKKRTAPYLFARCGRHSI